MDKTPKWAMTIIILLAMLCIIVLFGVRCEVNVPEETDKYEDAEEEVKLPIKYKISESYQYVFIDEEMGSIKEVRFNTYEGGEEVDEIQVVENDEDMYTAPASLGIADNTNCGWENPITKPTETEEYTSKNGYKFIITYGKEDGYMAYGEGTVGKYQIVVRATDFEKEKHLKKDLKELIDTIKE